MQGEINTPLIISLDENPTTGYLWHIEPQINMSVLSDKYISPTSDEIGGGGRREFSVVFIQPGKYQITAYKKRPWETHYTTKNFEINIE